VAASAGGTVAIAADDRPTQMEPAAGPSNAELLKELQSMKKRISYLEQELRKQKAANPPRTAAQSPAPQPSAAPREALTLAQPTGAAAPSPVVLAPPPAPPPAPTNKDLFGLVPSPVAGLKLGMYGEFNFGYQQNPAANGQWQLGADLARVVLLPNYKFNDNIIFNAEIEFEHAGTAFDTAQEPAEWKLRRRVTARRRARPQPAWHRRRPPQLSA